VGTTNESGFVNLSTQENAH